jgi:hypothetical protein
MTLICKRLSIASSGIRVGETCNLGEGNPKSVEDSRLFEEILVKSKVLVDLFEKRSDRILSQSSMTLICKRLSIASSGIRVGGTCNLGEGNPKSVERLLTI